MQTDNILEYHRRHAWQPFTQMKLAGDPVVIERARGALLYTAEGKEIIDAIGSWWVSVLGHNHPVINAAVEKQLEKLEQVMYAGFTHEPAALLSHQLSASTGDRLPRVFFSDNGSTAVEIALKMALQYFVNQGNGKKRGIIAMEGGYHGDTIGTMSVGARSVFHEMFEPLLFATRYVPMPRVPFALHNDDAEVGRLLAPALQALEETLRRCGSESCALILEPLIQGAGGMNIYPPLYLREVRRLCDQHDVFLIADEVFTGFGRTGSFYACQRAGIWPDIMALSKGLSAGYLPLAATLASERVFQGFYSDDRRHTFFHGHSMTANPLGCAAANAAFEILEGEETRTMLAGLERGHRDRLSRLAAGRLGSRIRETRFLGSVGVVELELGQNYLGEFGWSFWKRCIERGVLLRPLGPVLYLTPPYNITAEELDRVYAVLEDTALELLG